MNAIGRAALVVNMPGLFRKLLLWRLVVDTAAAFARPAPRLRGLSAEEALATFRDFTARTGAQTPLPHSVSSRLYAAANTYGKWIRRLFGIRTLQDAMAAARLVYRIIGIDFQGGADGDVTIARCFFSTAYTPEVCRLMSALDAGLLAGLSDGGQLLFSQRITEGYPCCRARLGSAVEAAL